MPVVIEQFEVVVDPPSPQPQAAGPDAPAQQAQPLQPNEILLIAQVHQERRLRVKAD